jgi:opacity protein-like surface antigen
MEVGGNNPSSSYRITGGYKLTSNISAELGYLHTSTGNYASSPQNSLYVSSEQLTAVYHYSIFGDFIVLGKLGITKNATGGDAVTSCNCSSSITFLYGLGAQYQLTKYLGTRIEYTNYGNVTDGATNGDLTMSSLSWGLLYNF